MKKLVAGKKVSNVKGMHKKDGTELTNVSLILDDNHQIKLVFENKK